MHPHTAFTGHHRAGSRRIDRAYRLLRCGHSARCRLCGNRIDVYPRSDLRPVALHPDELATAQTPEPYRWHLSCGIAHPHADGSAWCRIPHTLLCPGRATPAATPLTPHVEAVRRRLAVRSRRLIDTGAFAPQAPPTSACERQVAEIRRPVVQLLLGRYLADRPLEEIQCVARTRQRPRCTQQLLNSHTAAGCWRLLPAGPQCGQLALPGVLMAVYDLSRLPYAEQLRWRSQRCPVHAATQGAANLALTGWQVFDPLRHAEHIHTRLPHTSASHPGSA